MKLVAIATGMLAVLLGAAATAQTCTFSAFGRPCGGVLAGSQVRAPGAAVQLDLSAAAPNSVAVLVAGSRSRPVALPHSPCPLLVSARATQLQVVDGRGNASWLLRLPARAAFTIDFQVVTVALSRNGRTAESTNGLELTCR